MSDPIVRSVVGSVPAVKAAVQADADVAAAKIGHGVTGPMVTVAAVVLATVLLAVILF